MARGMLFLALAAVLVALVASRDLLQAAPSPELEGPFAGIRAALQRAAQEERDNLETLVENFRNATGA